MGKGGVMGGKGGGEGERTEGEENRGEGLGKERGGDPRVYL